MKKLPEPPTSPVPSSGELKRPSTLPPGAPPSLRRVVSAQEADLEATAQVDLKALMSGLRAAPAPQPSSRDAGADATAQVDLQTLMAGAMGGRSSGAEAGDATAQVDLQTLMAGAMAAGQGSGAPLVLSPGVMVGRYEVDTLLGKGGMGQVWQALDTELGRVVALKQLPERTAQDADARHVFTEEARALAQANHPNVVAVYDFIQRPDGLYMIMEHVQGEGLDVIISRAGRRMPLRRAAELGIQILAALHHIHDRSLVHRDIKPGNILVDRHGVARVMDFGLARLTTQMRQTGTLVRGTPWYMAPEQIQGHALTAAADLYAFGITLFELLTGELPFDRNDTGLERLEQTPGRIRHHRPELPQPLDALVQRCLTLEPKARPPALELIQGLLPYVSARCDYLPPCILPGWRVPEEATVEGALPTAGPKTHPELPVVLPTARELHASLPLPPEKVEVVHLDAPARPNALLLAAVAVAMLLIGAAAGAVVMRVLLGG